MSFSMSREEIEHYLERPKHLRKFSWVTKAVNPLNLTRQWEARENIIILNPDDEFEILEELILIVKLSTFTGGYNFSMTLRHPKSTIERLDKGFHHLDEEGNIGSDGHKHKVSKEGRDKDKFEPTDIRWSEGWREIFNDTLKEWNISKEVVIENPKDYDDPRQQTLLDNNFQFSSADESD